MQYWKFGLWYPKNGMPISKCFFLALFGHICFDANLNHLTVDRYWCAKNRTYQKRWAKVEKKGKNARAYTHNWSDLLRFVYGHHCTIDTRTMKCCKTGWTERNWRFCTMKCHSKASKSPSCPLTLRQCRQCYRIQMQCNASNCAVPATTQSASQSIMMLFTILTIKLTQAQCPFSLSLFQCALRLFSDGPKNLGPVNFDVEKMRDRERQKIHQKL